MALQGNIDSFSVVDVLRLLASSAKSGRLVVDGERGSAALWLLHGGLAAASVTPAGLAAVDVAPAEALADVLRLTEGAFAFEADVPMPPTSGVPVDVEAAIAEAQAAVAEWLDLITVVPSMRTSLSLAADLPAESIDVDRRLWSGVVAIAGVASVGSATVGDLAAHIGLAEMPALRLARDLAAAGLVDIGAEQAVHERPVAWPSPSPSASEPVRSTPDAVHEPVWAAPDPHADPQPAPVGFIGEPTVFDAFTEPFDPFGTTESAPGIAEASDDSTGEVAPSDPVDPFDTTAAPPADSSQPLDEADQQAEFARQLAMLSPRAAEAVALADAGPISEDEERARVARFLGSV